MLTIFGGSRSQREPEYRVQKPHTKRRRSRQVNFYKRLMTASITPNNKPSPLYVDGNEVSTIRVRALQHMTIIHLKRVLAGEVAEMVKRETTSAEQMERIRVTLGHYTTALRDLRYMLEPASTNQRTARFPRDLLYIESTRDSAVMVDAGIITSESMKHRVYLDVPDYTGYGGFSSRKDLAAEYSRGYLSRLKMALFGGIALVAPMLIMKLRPSKLTGLLTTSLFVLAVAIILAWYMKDANKKDILGATAAYAAVLVVFVGTSG
ncbi:hypothetical protein K458DRAFT_409895 [Lentithecium fluviatile CBS 122367]|uniref:DUF6594 domain-containing protein n=1 Tax=Lentithecium fluviatile CBS 122367 TaxID=1168545 RepID=A0A6G1IGD1_9PLEO|nr:hypothetical protein K458DRAFT_409895 [Lentithecium fluviatile CBS 122367]